MKFQFHRICVDGFRQCKKGKFLERELLLRDILLAKSETAVSIQTHYSSRQKFMAITVTWPMSNFRNNLILGDNRTTFYVV